MTKKTGIVIAAVLLASGMASAGYLDYFGQIAGTITVEGPTFYAASNDKLIFEEPTGSQITNYPVTGTEVEFFISEEMNNEWYPVELVMNVKAKHSGSMKGTLNLDFEYANSSGYYSVCDSEAQIQVDTSGQYKEYSKSCTGEIVGEVDHFYYNVRSSNNFDGDIITDGGTSVEVNAQ